MAPVVSTLTSFPPSSSSSPTTVKVASATSETSNAANVTKRLTSELMSLMMSPPDGVSAFPESDADLTRWIGRLDGAEGTPYEGHTYAISLSFPPTYPYAAPTVRFESTCFHPNVDLHGNICLDILKEKWAPTLSVGTILISLQSLLGDPNNSSPLNVEAADMWDNKGAYKKELAKWYKPLDDEA